MDIISITTLKTNVADIVRDINLQPVTITQNGDAKAVMMGKSEYDSLMDTLNMLKIVSLGKKQIDDGKTHSVNDAFKIATNSINE